MTFGRQIFSARFLNLIAQYRKRNIQRRLEPIFSKVMSKPLSSTIYTSIFEVAPIWFCWMQGEEQLPEIPKLCLQSIRKHSNGHPVIVLDADNFHQYVTVPSIVEEKYRKRIIKQAHYADIMRVNLLAQHGGLWLDATMLVIQPLSKEIFLMPFFSIKTPNRGFFVSRCRWAVFCLGGQAGNVIYKRIAQLFEEYLKNEDYFIDYFMFDQFIDMLYESCADIRQIIDNIPYNNTEVHSLNARLCDDFDIDEFNRLTIETIFFKLNWKMYSHEQLLANKNSYYYHLKELIES